MIQVCSLLLSHGADPTLLNCHSKSAIDVAPNRELQVLFMCHLRNDAAGALIILLRREVTLWLQERLGSEFKGHCLLDSCRQGDPQRLKKFLTAEVVKCYLVDLQITTLRRWSTSSSLTPATPLSTVRSLLLFPRGSLLLRRSAGSSTAALPFLYLFLFYLKYWLQCRP